MAEGVPILRGAQPIVPAVSFSHRFLEPPMTKLELVAAVARRLDISKASAAKLVGLFFGTG
jgi:hypothetical protein